MLLEQESRAASWDAAPAAETPAMGWVSVAGSSDPTLLGPLCHLLSILHQPSRCCWSFPGCPAVLVWLQWP